MDVGKKKKKSEEIKILIWSHKSMEKGKNDKKIIIFLYLVYNIKKCKRKLKIIKINQNFIYFQIISSL